RRPSLWFLPLAVAPLFVALSSCVEADPEEGIREAELLARTLSAAIEAADTAVIRDLFWPQATYEDYPNQHTYLGVDEIVGYVTGAHRWADDVLMNVGNVHPTADGGVVFEWVFSGVQTRPLDGVLSEGTGREVVLNGVTILQLDGGRVERAADYTDSGALLLQLGATVEMPDGTTVELR
ncbi:MAG: nuclear transport factor 2 family protein, partial [Gemmatimonadetes bacterium]|nr:nuclear transport factor 2 family protein [Gemmatimonadota bacterium]NNL30351.1 nuclear transport factor 2 family protein [Gemmatimonadota bacterium]